jgi:3',5'-cyclic AMP phosphodiesterase CpdA
MDRFSLRRRRSMKIAHLSDLHLLSLDGVPVRRFLNKRASGWINLQVKRGAIHRTSNVRAVLRAVTEARVDHVVVTGDLTNLALESEFDLARDILRRELGMDPSAVTIVPGNHDLYTRGALRSARFGTYFSQWLASDLPELAVDAGGGRFPIVRLRDGVAIVGLSSAVPRPPLIAAGELGKAQIEALKRILAHPEVSQRMAVLVLHHPVLQHGSALKQYADGLRDAAALRPVLDSLERGLILHGHLHRRLHRTIPTDHGRIDQVGATSASLEHEAPDRMAGFNVYQIDGGSVSRIEAQVYNSSAHSFHVESVPRHV